jgi:hypothetical protein
VCGISIEHKKCHLADYLLFALLWQNIDTMKCESAVNVQSEGDPIAVNTDVQLPSAFSIMKAESEVSCDFR